MSAEPIDVGSSLRRLPLVTLYLTERCNSRCVTCDYWRHGRVDLNLESVKALLPDLRRLDTRVVLISGGEPLLNPEWPEIAEVLRAHGLSLWLLTSGLSLAKHSRRVAELFDAVTVSLDGTNAATYLATRGLDAFDNVCDGIRAMAGLGRRVSVRVTLQRANYRELPGFVQLARELGAHQLSFLAVDVANPHAFSRTDNFVADLALQSSDLPVLKEILGQLERDCADDFRSGFIAETPQKLRRIHQYFAAVRGEAPYPAVRCNAPEFSAVVDAKAQLHPCFFIPGPPQPAFAALPGGYGSPSRAGYSAAGPLADGLNSEPMTTLRASIRAGQRPECATCVCSMWRDPATAADSLLPSARQASR